MNSSTSLEDAIFNLLTCRDRSWGARWKTDINLRRSSIAYLTDFVSILDLDDICEEQGFSGLHSTVCKLSCGDLKAQASAFPELLDHVDCKGLTPLHYAALLGDSNAVHILLKHGAMTGTSTLPVLWAAVAGLNLQCVEMLVEAGASLNIPTFDSEFDVAHEIFEDYVSGVAFSDQPWRQMDPDILAIDYVLLKAGFDGNARQYLGTRRTALMGCLFPRSQPQRLEILLDAQYDLDLEVTDDDGKTALHYSIEHHNLQAGSFLRLVQAGARVDTVNYAGHSILHLAICKLYHVDDVTLLAQVDLTTINLDTRNHFEHTAYETLQTRVGENRRMYNFPQLMPRDGFYSFNAWEDSIRNELQIIAAFRNLLCNIQEAQGVPVEARYPTITPAFSSYEEYEALKKAWGFRPTPLPGTWPEDDDDEMESFE